MVMDVERFKAKNERGEFVELKKLLPNSRSQIMGGSSRSNESKIELIRHDGPTFQLPLLITQN